MKTDYISPSVELFTLQGEQLICASGTLDASTEAFIFNEDMVWIL